MAKTITYAQWALESYCIGLKLRTLRTQKRLTLARLAAETGLSTALLSKLETDRMIPTLPTLATISRVYGVGMSHFFSEPARHTLSITRKAHLHSKGRGLESMKVTLLSPVPDASRAANLATDARNPTPAGSDHPLSPDGDGQVRSGQREQREIARQVVQLVEFPAAGAAAAMNGFRDASGMVYVLEGKLQLDAGGMQEVLEAGDCAYMESEMTVAWSAVGNHRCRLLAVFPASAWN
jgi:transcriptional regulator with XRE-family HTH domain/quercetin dioxygenase-like cupin family protein